MKRHFRPSYSLLDVMQADPVNPMPEIRARHQLTRMWDGLAAIERAEAPTTDNWRVCSDAVNLMETLVKGGQLADAHGLLEDAVRALAEAGRRHRAGHAIRLDAPGIQAVRAVLEDYRDALAALPERVIIAAHRETERRIHEILAGRNQVHDVEVMDL